MNLLLQSLASEEWTFVVKALLHTLWLGGLAAGGLYFVLRRETEPVTRYRWCVGTLLAVVLGGIVAWAVLQGRPVIGHPSGPPRAVAMTAQAGGAAPSAPMVSGAETTGPIAVTPPLRWTPWLALAWLGGAAAMLARAGSRVMEAEKLRRRCKPLENEAVLQFIEEARRKLGLARRIQVVVTERLTSPAVMGLLAPVLILPLSVVTTLPPGQLQLILLHELAHIRRGDYFVNLCQLLAESLLFFNPAVWWISRQIRQEREACCDAMAIAQAGERLQYARTLAQVAGEALAAAPAFGDRRNPSGLKDRIQRLLVPGYRPALRLTWSALLAGLFAGGGLLFLSALGTRWTVAEAAQLLTPQQRIDRIEKTMTTYGHPPQAEGEETEVSLTVRMKDGGPLPAGLNGAIVYSRGNGGSVEPMGAIRPQFSLRRKFRPGELRLCFSGKDIATSFSGPFDINPGPATNYEVALDAGFPIALRVLDADSAAALSGAALEFYFLSLDGNGPAWLRYLKTDEAGRALLEHGAALPLYVKVTAAGYENGVQRLEPAGLGEERRIAVKRALPTAGVVLDGTTKQPIAGASVYLLSADMLSENTGMGYHYPREINPAVATTDGQGRFILDHFVRKMNYGLLVAAPGHGGKVFVGQEAGNTNLQAELGPELRIRGTVGGDLSKLENHDGGPGIRFKQISKYGRISYSRNGFVPVSVDGNTGHFDFVLEEEGQVELICGGETFAREITTPVADWAVKAGDAVPAKHREVVLRFEHPPGAPPKGIVRLMISRAHRAYEDRDVEITNGEARVEVPVGGQFSYRPGNLIGYYFEDSGMVAVPDESGPMTIGVPVTPAGAIYVTARNADGSAVGDARCNVNGVNLQNDRYYSQGDGSRLFIQSPLPLGRTYTVVCTRRCSFSVSEPVELTEKAPDRKVELKFNRGAAIVGRVLPPNGRSLENITVALDWNCESASWSFPAFAKTTMDEHGQFNFKDAAPSHGAFSVTVSGPGLQSTTVPVDFARLPLTIPLQAGQKLSGRVLEAKSGLAVISADVNAQILSGNRLRRETTRTDELGNFIFDTLWEGDCHLIVVGADYPNWMEKVYKTSQTEPVVLKVTLGEYSGLHVAGKSARQ